MPRVQQIESVRSLHHLLIGGQHQFVLEQALAGDLVRVELHRQHRRVGLFEVVRRLLDFVLVEHIAVGDRAERAVGPNDVEDAFLALDVHSQAFESVGDLAHHGPAIQAAHLLEVGELRDLHAVQPHLPPQAPGAQGGRLPVVLDEADVVGQQVEAQVAQGTQVQLLKVVGRGLDADLELIVVLQAKRIVAVAAIRGPAGGLHIGRTPGFGAHRAQKSRGVKRAGPHLHVVGLQNDAALVRPVFLQRKNEILKGARRLGLHVGHRMLAAGQSPRV